MDIINLVFDVYWAREAICLLVAEYSEILGGYNEDGSYKLVGLDESVLNKRVYNRG